MSGNTYCQSITEARKVIEHAEELGYADEDVDDAFQYLIDHHHLAVMPAWYGRAAADLIRVGRCHER